MTDGIPEQAIAIIGMSGRFPGAEGVDAYWSNLLRGVEGIRRFSDEELLDAGVPRETLDHPRYVKANGVLERMEWFDAGFFKMSRQDARAMDPQTRHFLECVWHAFEDAGHVPDSFPGAIGVFAGAGAAQYFWRNVLRDHDLLESAGYFLLRHTGNDKDFLSTRASYAFDLKGPSVSIQTACSTSLVAVHYACQSLLAWECDMALAGGVTIEQPHLTGYLYEEGEILSPDGHCRPFDHRSAGTVFGSGVGVVVLRRLADAVEDGDDIRAVILGSAVNNDGAGKVSYLAPSVDGQAKVIAEALSVAGVSPDTIGMLEAHGTGTPVGDPIEVAALTRAYRTATDRKGYCALGSVKSNIGHLDTAAGVASLIKAARAVESGTIPPTLHFESPNELLELPASPFFVNGEVSQWPLPGPRRAGVSSLGVGGTNAHVILEEGPGVARSGPSRRWKLLTLSGRSSQVLEDLSSSLVDHIESHPSDDLADISFTLRHGRRRFDHRRSLVADVGATAIDLLAGGEETWRRHDVVSERVDRSVAFLFAGGGVQYANMARELYEAEPVFREVAEACFDQVERELEVDLRELIYCAPEEEDRANRELRRPSVSLPALFTVQLAQASLWRSWGIEASALIGHSMGEYTAACLAGVMSRESALALVSLRGKLFETLPPGGMLGVGIAERELRPRLPSRLSVAAVNGPEACVVSGPKNELDAFARTLEAEDIDVRRIHIDVAAHSGMLDPILDEFGRKVREIELRPPQTTLISNLTGEEGGAEVAQPDYWIRHLRETVRFSDGLSRILDPNGPILLEVGPGRALATLARMHPRLSSDQPILTSLPGPSEAEDAQAFQLGALGKLWGHGVDVDWSGFDGEEDRRRVPLPGYPFERKPYFVSPSGEEGEGATESSIESSDGAGDDPTRWTYQRGWVPTFAPTSEARPSPPSVLLLVEPGGFGELLAEAFEARGSRVFRVLASDRFERSSSDSFTVDPKDGAQWKKLLSSLKEGGVAPDLAIHAWCLEVDGMAESGREPHEISLLAPVLLLQALDDVFPERPTRLVAVSSGAIESGADELVRPARALLQGVVRVAPREIPNLETLLVEVGRTPKGGAAQKLAERVADEATVEGPESPVVVLRGDERLTERYFSTPVEGPVAPVLPPRSTVLITGGLGGIALEVAKGLVRDQPTKFVLLGRRAFPEPADRAEWLASHPTGDKTSRAIREIARIEEMGGEVHVASCDVTDVEGLKRSVRDVIQRFGGLNMVIHAAGILDDGPLLSRTPTQLQAVIAPKVQGTLALAAALEEVDLDEFVLFSSVSAFAGLPGQTDYAAANAFLDAFARSKTAEGRPTRSVAWGAWKRVGMAAELAGEAMYEASEEPAEPDEEVEGGLFDRRSTEGDITVLEGRYTKDRHWMIDEHRLKEGGDWVLPGAGYVELLKSAYDATESGSELSIEQLMFLRPLRFGSAESRDIQLRIEGGSGARQVSIRGRRTGESGWTEHATARIGAAAQPAKGVEPLPNAMERLGSPSPSEFPEHAAIAFGPRWDNVVGASVGGKEILLHQVLPTEFRADLESATLHPALLDMAITGGQHLIAGIDRSHEFLLPAGFGRIIVRGPIPPVLYTHVRLREWDEPDGLATFDVTIFHEDGVVAVEIEGFTMVRVSVESLGAAQEVEQESWLHDAIDPEEGVGVLKGILSLGSGSHVVVSRIDPERLRKEARTVAPGRRAEREARSNRVLREDVSAVLLEHPAIKEAVALGEPPGSETPRIVAFVVYDSGRRVTVSEIRRFLRARVGADMLPQNFVEARGLPRDSDGHVLKGELRDPFAEVDQLVEPRSDTEKAIAGIWADLLGLDRVGIHDNFLDVGGHSLVGIRVLKRIHEATGVRVEANALTMQTLEQLAGEIDRKVNS